MSALEQLAEAVLDGRVRVQMQMSVTGLGIPTGATFYLDVDPVDDELAEEIADELAESSEEVS
jgi:hypothetical protein